MKENDENSYSHILKYTGVFGGVQGINILISLVRTKCVALLLGPGGMGLSSLFQTTTNFISQATNLGISFSAVRNVSELFESGDGERIVYFAKVIRAWSLLTGLIGMLVCMAIGPLLNSATFTWGDHTLHFVMLSPLVAMLAVTGGEMAILKGTRQLKSLAVIQLYNVFFALFLSVPAYYFFGLTGIIPVMLLMGVVSMLLTVRRSFSLYPFQLGGLKVALGDGLDVIRLGIAFTLAGILGSGADFAIRSYLSYFGDLDVVGLYNAGFMMTMTYAGLIFSAMETDYFPRLSAVNNDIKLRNDMINKQAEVSLLLISPLVVVAIFFLPIAIPLLTSDEFLPVVDMMRITALSLYLRAVNLSIEYLSLARNASLSYLFLESVYDLMMVLFVIIGYNNWGLTGTGCAILLTVVLNTVLVLSYTGSCFHFRIRWELVRLVIAQMAIGVLAFYVCMVLEGLGYWLVAVLLTVVSLYMSVRILYKKTHVLQNIRRKIIGRIVR